MTRVLFLSASLLLTSSTAGTTLQADEAKSAPPPADAKVLFDGKDLSGWVKRGGQPAEWKVENGYMEVVSGKGDVMTKEKFGPDFHLHVEFWLPKMPPEVKDQARANSGVYVQGRYEIQVLDMWENKTYANGSVGALYGILTPDAEAQKRAVKPPEQWNSYDITFYAPRVDEQGKVTRKGRITVKLNGVALIENGEFDRNTPGEVDKKLGEPGPVLLQDHSNKGGGPNVRYRNIWLKPLN